MNVGFFYSSTWEEIGEPDLLQAFFSTISYNLEPNGWGTKYPYVLNKLYYKKLERGETEFALKELVEIREKLSSLSADKMIWNIEDLKKEVPKVYKENLKSEILSERFISVGGGNIIENLIDILEWCTKKNFTLEIRAENDIYR